MSNSNNLLSNCTSSPFSSITLGNGTGHTELPTPIKPLLLRDVLVAPALIKNLISVRKFTSDNLVSIEFDPFGLSVKDLQTKEEIARFNSSGDLYSINGAPAASPPSSMMASVHLWHQRLGHPNAVTTSTLLSEFSLPCNNDHHDPLVCESCQQGKHVHLPFRSSSSYSSFPFELLHCDIWTSPHTSISGFQYYLVILDDFTHFIWTFPLKHKSDAHTIFIIFQ